MVGMEMGQEHGVDASARLVVGVKPVDGRPVMIGAVPHDFGIGIQRQADIEDKSCLARGQFYAASTDLVRAAVDYEFHCYARETSLILTSMPGRATPKNNRASSSETLAFAASPFP